MLLPVGTIIKLDSDMELQLMIIGYYPVNNETGQRFHYIGTLYPYGIENKDSFILFNEEDVSTVVFEGYSDEEGNKFRTSMPQIINLLDDNL